MSRESLAPDTVIFDWDGTLAQTLDLWLRGYQAAFAARGHQFAPQFIVSEFFHNHDQIPARYPELEFPAIAQEVRDLVFEGLSTVALYDGAPELLEHLATRGVTLGLVSSSARNILSDSLKAHGLEACFQHIVAGDDGFGYKPSPGPFHEMLRRLGATPAQTIAIGDTVVDIQASRAVGCASCFFAPDRNQMFHDFAEIRDLQPSHEITALAQFAGLCAGAER